MDKLKQSLGELFIGLTEAAFIIFYSSFTGGLVVYKFLQWFINPVFTSFPAVNYWQAMGLALVIDLFKNSGKKDKEQTKTDYWTIKILTPWVALLIGLIINAVIN